MESAAVATGEGGDIDAIDDEDVLRQLVMFTIYLVFFRFTFLIAQFNSMY